VQSRRAALLSAAVLAASALPGRALAAAPAGRGGAAGPARSGRRVRLGLPAPSGPHPVGTVALRLVDATRPDPWTGQPYRELMVSVRYPAAATEGYPAAPQMLPGEAAGFVRLNSLAGVPAEQVDWAATRTHAHTGAPVAPGRRPVLLYSPGAGDPRALGTTLCDDLASRGYAVVTVDHTYDAGAVEFPGGRVELSVLPAEFAKVAPDPEHVDPAKVAPLLEKTVNVRSADVRSVLDLLPAALPRALRAALDWSRTGAFGQSAGGFTALQAMHDDPRIAAAANFDGVTAYVQEDGDHGYLPPLGEDGLRGPFLLVGKDGNTRRTVPSWDALWRRSTGPRTGLFLRGAEHGTYTDAVVILPQLARRLQLPRATVEANIGTVAPRHAVAADRACLAAFFDRALRDRDDHGLLERPSARYPEVRLFS
jgi:dienelactone hydrolase